MERRIMVDALLRTWLEQLRRCFSNAIDAGARLQCCLIEWPRTTDGPLDQSDGAHGDYPPEFTDTTPISSALGIYRWGIVREVNLYGAHAVRDNLNPCFADAGHLLAALSPNDFPVPIPPATLATDDESRRWLYFLFDLAWAEIPGSLVRAATPPSAWYKGGSINLPSLDVYRGYAAQGTEVRGPLADFCKFIPDSPAWYSVIDDVVQASLYAIDVLLTVAAPSDCPNGNGDAGPNRATTEGETLPARIQGFIAIVEAYLSAGRSWMCPSPGGDLPANRNAFNESQRTLLDAVEPLAYPLEAAGIDAFGVRKFRNAVEGADGWSAAKGLWLDLKTWLQGIAARRDLGPAKTSEKAGNADAGPPPAAKTQQGEGDGGDGATTPPAAKTEADLQPADRKAYYAYSWAEGRLLEAGATRVTDREAYDWLQENGLPDEKDSLQLATEFAGYRLPAFDTWNKQVRNARKVLGDQKHQKRAGRAAGRSIARGRAIERQHGADD